MPRSPNIKKGANSTDSNREFGTTLSVWWANPQALAWMNKEDCGLGSYSENAWVRTGPGLNTNKQWYKMSNITNTSIVPFIGDTRWNNTFPRDSDPLPLSVSTEAQYYPLEKWSFV